MSAIQDTRKTLRDLTKKHGLKWKLKIKDSYLGIFNESGELLCSDNDTGGIIVSAFADGVLYGLEHCKVE